jgi:hypothetical protein
MGKDLINAGIFVSVLIFLMVIIFFYFNNYYNQGITGAFIDAAENQNDYNLKEQQTDYSQQQEDYTNYSYDSTPEQIPDYFETSSQLHFSHVPIIYKFSQENFCESDRISRIKLALEEISKETNKTVSFTEGDNPDIIFNCYKYYNKDSKGDFNYETLGEGGIINESGQVILGSVVNFYASLHSSGYFPFTEIHEILHAFGFDHYDKPCSIMYPEENSEFKYNNKDICYNRRNPTIDPEIIDQLIDTYTINPSEDKKAD